MPKYLLLLVCFCLLGAAVALGQHPAVPGTAWQAAQPTPENAPRGAAPAGRRYQVRAGAVVLGWYPGSLPARAYEQMDFSLLSHLAYGGYRATDQGLLERPPHPLAEALAAVRHANPSCKVLLSVEYQEAQSGPGLFAEARLPARQQLAAAIVRELAATRADGVNLEFAFRAAPELSVALRAPASPQRLSAAEKKEAQRQLNQERLTINKLDDQLQREAAQLRTQQHSTDYAQRQQAHRLAKASFVRRRKVYRVDFAAVGKGLRPPSGLLGGAARQHAPTAEATRAAWLAFVTLLHEMLTQEKPGATLAITLPAVDRTGSFAHLGRLVPAVQLVVLKEFDYTESLVKNGPLAPLHPSPRWGKAAVSTSVGYYLAAKVPASKLVVTFPHYCRVSSTPASPNSGVATPPRLFTNLALRGSLLITEPLDAASGSQLAQLRPTPALAPALASASEVWIEDTASLAAKYAWVARQHLGGVGIMALSYDSPSTLAWPLLQAGLAKVRALPAKTAPQSTLKAGVHVGLFAGATLLGFAFLGSLISALLHAPAIIPFRSRLLKVGLMLGGCLLVLLLYSYFLGPQYGRPLLVTCLAGLGTLAAGIGYHRLREPRQLP